jgi:hypothetical protein
LIEKNLLIGKHTDAYIYFLKFKQCISESFEKNEAAEAAFEAALDAQLF